jgi:hypothetical protein
MGPVPSLEVGGAGAAFDRARAFHETRIQRAMLAATRIGAERLERRLRERLAGASLAGLGRALKATSDQQQGRGVHLNPSDGLFSASGLVVVRSGSARTRGALTAYTAGAVIRPVRARWLWFPSEDIQRLVGKGRKRQRLTPGNWESSGMAAKLGPLVPIKSVNGFPLLIVHNVGTSLAGAARSAKPLNKNGKAKKGQRARTMIVAFIAIPNTTRAWRVDVRALHREAMASLPATFGQQLERA